MRKFITQWTLASIALVAFNGCDTTSKNETMQIINPLSEAEKSAGILTPEILWKMGRITEAVLSPDGTKVLYTVTHYNMAKNKSESQLWAKSTAGGAATQITQGERKPSSVEWSGDGKQIYFLSSRQGEQAQVWTANPDGENLRQLTYIAQGVEAYGVAPDGKHLFYVVRVKVEPRSGADKYADTPESKVKIYDDLMARHWNCWDDGSYLHIFVAGINEHGAVGAGKDILENEPWDAPMAPYFDRAEIAWNHAGTQLAYGCKKLKGKEYALSTNADLYLYDLTSGTTRNLTEGLPGYDNYPSFSPDDSKLAFRSMSRAGNESDKARLMVIEIATGMRSDWTARFDYSASNLTWKDARSLYFIAPMRGTHQLCEVNVEGEVKTLTRGAHDLNMLSMGGGRVITSLTTLCSPAELFEIDLSNGTLLPLTNTNPEIYAHIQMGEVQERWVKTSDGKQMLTWVVLPPNFDATKKYPVLLYCQGGPQSTVSQFWSYRWNFQIMAAQGYIVVAPNRRGVPSFGQEWLDQISGDYSGQNMRDYLSAIDDVAREPWADETRMGCVGASYGGYSSYYLAGHHEKRFKAFIAHCGMFNLESMYGSTEELYFVNNDLGGPYWSENQVAKRSYAHSPHQFVRNWDSPMLILVGLNDYRIPYTESLQAFTAARLMNLPARLVVFEDEGHQIFKPQNSLIWQREFFGWLDQYVKNSQFEE